jgi:DNA-binding transcriptional MerR regulator
MSLYKPSEAARMLSDMTDRKVSPSTLRSWCSNNEVAPYLSDMATPEPGESRLLTDNDLAVLIRVQELRRQRLSFVEVGRKLATAPDAPTESPDAPTEAPQTALAPTMDLDAIAPLLQAISTNQIKSEQIAVLNDQMKNQASELKQVRVLVYAGLLAMVLVLIAVIILVLVLR